jgi:hypothetical protein
MAIVNILILDDAGTPSLASHGRSSFTKYLPQHECNVFVITSIGGLSEDDKKRCAGYAELASPSTDGSLELIARAWNQRSPIDRIYTRQEDLLLRASHLRRLLGVKDYGLQPESMVRDRKQPVSFYCGELGDLVTTV